VPLVQCNLCRERCLNGPEEICGHEGTWPRILLIAVLLDPYADEFVILTYLLELSNLKIFSSLICHLVLCNFIVLRVCKTSLMLFYFMFA